MFAEWTPVKIAVSSLKAMGDYPSLVTGSAVVQGVAMTNGTRFLVFDSSIPADNGIFELYAITGGLDIRRPADADDEDDFNSLQWPGKRVLVLGGLYPGYWEWRGPYVSAGPVRFVRGYIPDSPVDPLGSPLALTVTAAPVAVVKDAREPMPASPVALPPKSLTQSGISEADVTPAPLVQATRPAFFNLVRQITLQGDPITIQGQPLLTRI